MAVVSSIGWDSENDLAEQLVDINLADGEGVERAGPRAGGVAWYSGR
jgi:hypothetical protein